MNGTQRASVPTPQLKSSDFSIEKILSKNVSSYSSTTSTGIKITLPLQEKICPSFLDQNIRMHYSPPFDAQNKLNWLRNFYRLYSSNSQLQLNITESNKTVVKSSNTINQFDNFDKGNSNNKELSWLQCTRYHPPKLPRKSNSSKNLRRKPGTHPRIPFTKYQLEKLEDEYKKNVYVSRKDVMQLSNLLHLPQNRIKIWFQNRRARERRESQ